MNRHDTLIIKDTHRGLLYEDGVFQNVLPAGRYQIPRAPSGIAAYFRSKAPKIEVVLVDVRGRDRTVVVQELLTADGATISTSFVVQFRVVDPLAALHQVKNFEERLYAEAQTAARRVLRGLSVEEVLGSRDEIGEEMLRLLQETAGSYGLEVTGLDFKDLIIPEELRKVMNRAVLAKRLRQAQQAEGLSIVGDDDDLFLPSHEDQDLEDDSELIIARADFARAREADRDPEPRLDGLSIRPHAQEHRGGGFQAGGFDVAMRRCNP